MQRISLNETDVAIRRLGNVLHALRHLADAQKRQDPDVNAYQHAVEVQTRRYLIAAADLFPDPKSSDSDRDLSCPLMQAILRRRERVSKSIDGVLARVPLSECGIYPNPSDEVVVPDRG